MKSRFKFKHCSGAFVVSKTLNDLSPKCNKRSNDFSTTSASSLQDHVNDLLTHLDMFLMAPNISLNFDLTKAYLDLITTYVSLLILLSRVEDRKAVLGLFNAAYEIIHGQWCVLAVYFFA